MTEARFEPKISSQIHARIRPRLDPTWGCAHMCRRRKPVAPRCGVLNEPAERDPKASLIDLDNQPAKSVSIPRVLPEPNTARPRCIRDPIHGDIRLEPLESAVVDTRIFQRLRYIRQNGLLHLIFPGAVHSRFAHSLGTMQIARRVAASLFGSVSEKNLTEEAVYLSQAFRLAALLHDVGHGAFSHSIEHAKSADGRPLLGTVQELLHNWQQHVPRPLSDFLTSASKNGTNPVTHEQIGLILVHAIFLDERVQQTCSAAGFISEQLCQDVQALMDGKLPVSARFIAAAEKLATGLTGTKRDSDGVTLARILHGLISGTLDVDRLDYLVRDSTNCGVPYGACEVDLLVKSLSISEFDGKLSLLLDRKAAHALDDMLWSRYQLFLQVLNHKTNVGLNATLGKAITEASRVTLIQLPKSMQAYVAFVDDFVIGQLFRIAQTPGADLDDTPYIRTLVDRRVPRHLWSYRLQPGDDPAAKEEEIRSRLSQEHGVSAGEIFVGTAKSELEKASQHLPYLVDGQRNLIPFAEESSVLGANGVGSGVYRVLHFYVDRTGR